jgi:hypothetical protein
MLTTMLRFLVIQLQPFLMLPQELCQPRLPMVLVMIHCRKH